MAQTYLLIIFHLLGGLVILILFERISMPHWLHISPIIFGAFVCLNLFYVRIFKLQESLKKFWSINKAHFLIIGISGGVLLAVIPALASFLFSHSTTSGLTLKANIQLSFVAITFFTTAWEELWFRGLFLNHCRRHLSTVHLSVLMGFLFMLLHLLNPSIRLLYSGPSLFFAGALLTLLYFRFKNIWLPLGLHFGNNLTQGALELESAAHAVYGNDGFLSAGLLATLFVFFITQEKMRRKNRAGAV